VEKSKEKENAAIISERLRILRNNANLTQAEFAKMYATFFKQDCAYHAYTISEWEHGKVPRAYVLKNIARFYNVSYDYLLGKTNEMDYILSKREAHFHKHVNEISFSNLKMYDNMPLYVVSPGHFPDCWCIYNAETNSIQTLTMKYPVSPDMRFFTFSPKTPDIYSYDTPLSLAKLMERKQVFVITKTKNAVQNSVYNGWYHHNETKTALINDRGNVLLYSDLNILYNAY